MDPDVYDELQGRALPQKTGRSTTKLDPLNELSADKRVPLCRIWDHILLYMTVCVICDPWCDRQNFNIDAK